MTLEPKTLTQKQKLLGLTLALALIVGGVSAHVATRAPTGGVQTPEQDTSSNPTGSVSVGLDGVPEGVTAEVIGAINEELFNNTPRPSTARALPQTGVSSEAYAVLVNKRASLVSEIEKNPAAMQNWLALGTVHKQVNDYEGARIYYLYVATVNPGNLAAHWALGTLYKNYLKDIAKAEAQFRAIISIDSSYTPAYLELFSMFAEAQNWKQAETIMLEAIAKLPKDIDLRIAQAQYFRSRGMTTEAKVSYDAAIALARQANNANLATSLEAEKANLR